VKSRSSSKLTYLRRRIFPFWNSSLGQCSNNLAFSPRAVFSCLMKFWWIVIGTVLLNVGSAAGASKPHVVAFGRWAAVKWQPDDDTNAVDVKARPLLVDGKVKDFTTGLAHDVTDRTFVVQRMFRVNDSLPQETGPTRWRWERGGWLLVHRVSGRVQQIALPEFDAYRSQVSWFRDYVAYCGVSDDGQKAFAVIAQLGKRRPLLKKTLGEGNGAGCSAPAWQRDPVRVTFATKEDPRLSFTVNSRFVDLAPEEESEGEE
jgi:hypothetical protein